MGLFDTVKCDAQLSNGDRVTACGFQTKSLGRCMDNYCITAQGRLVMIRKTGWTVEQDITIDTDTEYHGDILLFGNTLRQPDDGEHYVARFTHGQLEWIKPLGDYPSGIYRFLSD